MPGIGKGRRQADTRGVGKRHCSAGAAVDLQLLSLREFQEAFSFPRENSPGTALLSILPFTRSVPQRLTPAKNTQGTCPAAASWAPLSRQPVPGQLAAQKQDQRATLHTLLLPPCPGHPSRCPRGGKGRQRAPEGCGRKQGQCLRRGCHHWRDPVTPWKYHAASKRGGTKCVSRAFRDSAPACRVNVCQ